jgi:precorrin-2 dehydrogenase/sirohydrochlorin ferrochelatase
MTVFYPVYLDLKDQPALVVGGGKIAEGKVAGLLASEARVTVVSPDLAPRLRAWAGKNQIKHIPRVYQAGDLTGAFLVVCATDQTEVNQRVWQQASANGQLVNVVDDPLRCNFIAPAVLRNGDLTIAISTGGKAPALAVRLKEHFEAELGPEYARFLELAGQLREPLARHVPDFEARKALWYELVDSDVLDLLARGNDPAALEVISQIVGFPLELS